MCRDRKIALSGDRPSVVTCTIRDKSVSLTFCSRVEYPRSHHVIRHTVWPASKLIGIQAQHFEYFSRVIARFLHNEAMRQDQIHSILQTQFVDDTYNLRSVHYWANMFGRGEKVYTTKNGQVSSSLDSSTRTLWPTLIASHFIQHNQRLRPLAFDTGRYFDTQPAQVDNCRVNLENAHERFSMKIPCAVSRKPLIH
jgi:hypothetical protein